MAENRYEFSDREERELIDEGVYEVVLDTAEVRSYKSDSSKQYLSLKYIIRQDVEQKFCGRWVFESVFRDKNNPDQFDHRKLQKIILTQKGKDTFQNKFANEDELIQYINGLTMQIHISVKDPDDYHETQYNEVKYLSYRPSSVKLAELGTPATTAAPKKQEFIDFNTDELPF